MLQSTLTSCINKLNLLVVNLLCQAALYLWTRNHHCSSLLHLAFFSVLQAGKHWNQIWHAKWCFRENFAPGMQAQFLQLNNNPNHNQTTPLPKQKMRSEINEENNPHVLPNISSSVLSSISTSNVWDFCYLWSLEAKTKQAKPKPDKTRKRSTAYCTKKGRSNPATLTAQHHYSPTAKDWSVLLILSPLEPELLFFPGTPRKPINF